MKKIINIIKAILYYLSGIFIIGLIARSIDNSAKREMKETLTDEQYSDYIKQYYGLEDAFKEI